MTLILFISLISLLSNIFSLFLELFIFKNAPFLENKIEKSLIETELTIIIPTFNEENNIAKCLEALSKIKMPCKSLRILVVDDSSIDKTFSIAKNYISKFSRKNINLEVIPSGSRPNGENWVGKNWPCYIGSQKVSSKWLLFIDADVEVGSDCIFNALFESESECIDLLSLAPKVNCNCLAEWIVQPIMTSLLTIGFPISKTNNPENETSFAAGPFMLFKSDSYLKIGGHKGTFDQVVEDLALAKKIKSFNLKLKFLIAIKDISLNMYSNFNSLLEGWSKNWFLGLDRNIFKSLSASGYVLLTFSTPWLLLFFAFSSLALNNFNIVLIKILIISLLAIISYAYKRYWLYVNFKIPMNYWFLNGLGGIIVFYISFLSIYKTITGSGWTWKGRNLINKN